MGDVGEDYRSTSMLAGLFWSSQAQCYMEMYPTLFDVVSLARAKF
jgi:hypothetical protein